MATTPIAYNPSQSPIDGTDQVGTLAVGITEQDYSLSPGGVTWWNGPEESTGYVIAVPVSGNTQPTPIPDDAIFLSPTYKGTDVVLYDNNQTAVQIFGYQQSVLGINPIGTTDKVMFSVLCTLADPGAAPDSHFVGVGYTTMNYSGSPYGGFPGTDNQSMGYGSGGDIWYNGGVYQGGLQTWGNNDIIDIVIDNTTSDLWVRVNGGNWNNNPSANPATGSNGIETIGGPFYPVLCPAYEGTMIVQNSPTYSVPSGYNFLGNFTASVGFFESVDLTENSFVQLTNTVFSQNFTNGLDAKTWLNDNGYWTSFVPVPVSPTPTPTVTPTRTLTPTPTATVTPSNTPNPPNSYLFYKSDGGVPQVPQTNGGLMLVGGGDVVTYNPNDSFEIVFTTIDKSGTSHPEYNDLLTYGGSITLTQGSNTYIASGDSVFFSYTLNPGFSSYYSASYLDVIQPSANPFVSGITIFLTASIFYPVTPTPTPTQTGTPTTPTPTPTPTRTSSTPTPTPTLTQTPSPTPFQTLAGSLLFNGTNQSLSLSPGVTFGAGAFTLEGWFYNNDLFVNKGIVGSPVTSPVGCLNLYFANGTTITSDRNGGGGSFSYVTSSAISANVWHYLIYNRNADGTTAVYIDGVRAGGTQSDTLNYTTATDTIGRFYGGYWPGNWTNMRMTIGTAVYNSNLTTQSTPRGPLTSLANTQYLMLGAVVTTDSSGTQTVTNNNGVTQTSDEPF
jgi:hypothetical protein